MKKLVFLLLFAISTTGFAQYSETAPDFVTVKGSARFGDGWGSTAAFGKKTFAAGLNNVVSGENSIALGVGLTVRTPNQFAFGTYNPAYGSTTSATTPTDPLAIFGNGVAPWAPSMAMVILRNGNVGIGNFNWPPMAQLHIAYDEYKNPDEATFRADGSTYSTTIHDDQYEDVNINGGNDYSFVNLARPAGQRVGIGANPDNGPEKFYVSGASKFKGYVASTEGFFLYDQEPAQGSLIADSKSFFQKISENLVVVSYKKDSITRSYISINPENKNLVKTNTDKSQVVNQSQLLALALGALGEQKKLNDQLIQENTDLKKRLAKIEEMLKIK